MNVVKCYCNTTISTTRMIKIELNGTSTVRKTIKFFTNQVAIGEIDEGNVYFSIFEDDPKKMILLRKVLKLENYSDLDEDILKVLSPDFVQDYSFGWKIIFTPMQDRTITLQVIFNVDGAKNEYFNKSSDDCYADIERLLYDFEKFQEDISEKMVVNYSRMSLDQQACMWKKFLFKNPRLKVNINQELTIDEFNRFFPLDELSESKFLKMLSRRLLTIENRNDISKNISWTIETVSDDKLYHTVSVGNTDQYGKYTWAEGSCITEKSLLQNMMCEGIAIEIFA